MNDIRDTLSMIQRVQRSVSPASQRAGQASTDRDLRGGGAMMTKPDPDICNRILLLMDDGLHQRDWCIDVMVSAGMMKSRRDPRPGGPLDLAATLFDATASALLVAFDELCVEIE